MDRIQTPRRAPFGTNPEVGEAGRATQQRILAAANEAFGDLGYARTSVEAITDRAGCSRPTFYQYFSGKEDLHRRLAARFGTELAELVGGLDRVTPDAAGRTVLLDWFRRLAATYERYRAVADNFDAAVRTDERMVTGAADLSTRYRQALLQALDPADVAATGIEPEGLAAAANVIGYAACLHREQFGRVSADRLAEALADLVHRTFFGPRPGVNLGPPRAPRLTRAPRLPDDADDTPRRPRGQETRQRLLDAAASTFAVLGFEATRVDDIATEAGMSHGTFYRYFDDKEAAFTPHLVAAVGEILELVGELPVDDARGWSHRYVDCYARHGGTISVWLEATAAGVDVARTARTALAVALGERLVARSFGDVDADVIAAFALLENLPAAAFAGRGLSPAGAADAMAVIVERGFFGG